MRSCCFSVAVAVAHVTLLSATADKEMTLTAYSTSVSGLCKTKSNTLNEALLQFEEARQHIDIKLEFLAKYDGPRTMCGNGTVDGDCEFLLDNAHLCAQRYESDWWPFSWCLFRDQEQLQSQLTYETSLANCSTYYLKHTNYFSLSYCIHGNEGDALRNASYARTSGDHLEHPLWVNVNGRSVSIDDYDDGKAWAKAILDEAGVSGHGWAQRIVGSETSGWSLWPYFLGVFVVGAVALAGAVFTMRRRRAQPRLSQESTRRQDELNMSLQGTSVLMA